MTTSRMTTPRKSLSIIGMGAFGRFMAPHLRDHFDVAVCDRADTPPDDAAALAGSLQVRAATLQAAAAAEIVVLAVPVQVMDELLSQLAPHVAPGALVLDVCSVKIEPIAMLLHRLPPMTQVVGLHPLFGPQSGRDGIKGLPIALCPARAEPPVVAAVEEFLRDRLGLRVLPTTAQDHDRQMAYVQGLTHFLSRALGTLDLPQTPMATRAYERFLAMKADLHADSLDLFLTIERHNPYAREVRASLLQALAALERQIQASSSSPP